MKAVRALVAGALALTLIGTADTALAAPVPTSPTSPAATPVVPPADPAVEPSDVVVLHTETGADARSGELHAAIARLGGTVRHTFSGQQTISLQLPADTDPTAAAVRLADLPGVARVEPPVTRTFGAVPNDPKLSGQRAYLDAVAAPAAWDRQRGSAAVRIAVVDSGVDVNHPDLRGKIAGRYNAVTGSSNVTDTVGHGTFVAGVAAARTDNHIGVAGAGYDSSILAVKVADNYGDIAVDDEIAGIRWAADHGAQVINLSLSGPDSSAAELRAVQYAQSKGSLVVAAAGNDGNTAKQYPAAYPGVVAVAATDPATKGRASFSSHGSWVTLAAPGVDLLSTTPTAGSDYYPDKTGYGRGDGTSFAAPLVAGAAALLESANPALTPAQLRAALVASAHGYGGSDVGHGQIDYDLALDHVTPATQPLGVLTSGNADTITARASSSAPRVSFRIDDGPWLPAAPVANGTATLQFASYGYANMPASHTVSARDCSRFGECNAVTPAQSLPFTLVNATPSLTVDAAVSGPFTVSGAASGGGLRLMIDGTEAGFDAAAPYAFDVNGSLFADAAHDLTVQTCTSSHSLCAGPVSDPTTVDFDSLHPVITGLSRDAISPNDDRSGDTATLTFRTDQDSDVTTIVARDAAGTDVRTESAPSDSAYVWDGLDDAGRPVHDGTYRLRVETTSYDGQKHGLAERTVVVDTVGPRLTKVTGNNTRFFPVRDGYRDTFAPSAALPDGGRFTFAITTSTGRAVRTLRATRGPTARVSLAWNGRDTAGRRVGAGGYRWTFTAADAAGNVTRTASYRTYVDSRRLVTRTVSLVRSAKAKVIGTARCATKRSTRFKRGVHLVNRCRGGSGEVSYTNYAIAVPAALKYTRLTFATYGRSSRTSQLSASFRRTDGGLEVPRAIRAKRSSSSRWRTVANLPAAGHLNRGTVRVSLVLTTRYAGTNDFDARSVRLRVTLVKLG